MKCCDLCVDSTASEIDLGELVANEARRGSPIKIFFGVVAATSDGVLIWMFNRGSGALISSWVGIESENVDVISLILSVAGVLCVFSFDFYASSRLVNKIQNLFYRARFFHNYLKYFSAVLGSACVVTVFAVLGPAGFMYEALDGYNLFFRALLAITHGIVNFASGTFFLLNVFSNMLPKIYAFIGDDLSARSAIKKALIARRNTIAGDKGSRETIVPYGDSETQVLLVSEGSKLSSACAQVDQRKDKMYGSVGSFLPVLCSLIVSFPPGVLYFFAGKTAAKEFLGDEGNIKYVCGAALALVYVTITSFSTYNFTKNICSGVKKIKKNYSQGKKNSSLLFQALFSSIIGMIGSIQTFEMVDKYYPFSFFRSVMFAMNFLGTFLINTNALIEEKPTVIYSNLYNEALLFCVKRPLYEKKLFLDNIDDLIEQVDYLPPRDISAIRVPTLV